MKRLITLLASLLLLGSAAAVAQEYVSTPVTVSKEKVKLNGKVYLSHVVLERQTLFGIAKAYGVNVEELYEANPSLHQTGLQKNAILLVPYREAAVQEEVKTPQGDGSYTEHTVKWYEDIEDIARRYDVTVKDIMELNGLKSKKLSTRQVLRIPVKAVVAEAVPADSTAMAAVPPAEKTPAEQAGVPAAQPDSTLLTIRKHEGVDFSLVLPLQAGGRAGELNMDFYSGVLLALKDMEAEGTKVQAHIYDLSAGLPPVDALVRSDFVLGPVASRELEAILQRVDSLVPVISPLDQKATVLSTYYRNFIQVPSAAENQYEDLAEWLKDDADESDRIILISEKGAGNVSAPVAIRSAMARRDLNYEILNYAIVEGRSIPARLAESMSREGTNRVVVASESEAFMGDVVRNLGIMLGKDYDIVMYAPSKVRTFETIEGSAYHNASLHICTSYFADYTASEVDRFVKSYRSLFRTEPSQFAFQGYDVTRYFVKAVARYGNAWTSRLGAEKASGLHTDFLFDTDENGNHFNTAVRRIIFRKDYTTTLED
ncbi:MAG: LysM peptidoglycan-binding domain-containing protein [Bacteroidales bacterium]|nr:LysM peptidoglycan-binding domain-containing protein [Bacteroidales bacterium]